MLRLRDLPADPDLKTKISNTLLSSSLKAGLLPFAFELLHHMREANIPPNETAFNSVLQQAAMEDMKAATAFYDKMVQGGMGNLRAVAILIEGHLKNRNPKEAFRLITNMPQRPTTRIFNVLLDWYVYITSVYI